MAVGCSPPMPSPCGLSKKPSSSISTVMTTVTLPISTAWVKAPSLLSAKKSRKPKMTPQMRKSASQSGAGMMPSAVCTRSLRASWRCEVWSIQRS